MAECAGCLKAIDRPVMLAGGEVVCSDCPRWRAECELRHVAGLADDELMAYVGLVKLKRGTAAAVELERGVQAWREAGRT